MARYRGPACRLCRREGIRLYLKGERCYTPKCEIEKRAYPPGQHAQSRRKLSDYGLQLREKQRMRRYYGLTEAPFRQYFEAAGQRPGVTGENLLQILERRLDNVIHRLGFGASRRQARQSVDHGHFLVNGRPCNLPARLLEPGDVVAVKESSRAVPAIVQALSQAGGRRLPPWLELDAAAMQGRVVSWPRRDEIDTPVQEQLVVEYYSR